ncbi:type I restriction endonuclease [Helicobacter fennelliae]|uniref:type I restriction endonuclease n=1 Tax=Helicobacter fennelliae TaxID=215 RepID=UPI00215D8D80|nr:type I restriction endonuclease [Helicobacter fennelliae]
MARSNADLGDEEREQIFESFRLVGGDSAFATLHKVYNLLINGMPFSPQNEPKKQILLIDFENPRNNTFCVLNQFVIEYTNNGQKQKRVPDIVLFVNGVPLCIIELKNPADFNANIYSAWEQIYVRYWRDIGNLFHYCVLACISDGVKTRLGTVRTAYQHFYAWRRVNDGDKLSTLPFDEMQSMIKGVYEPSRFLEIFRDYIYFEDSIYDSNERQIVCRYPQFFATRKLKQSIIESIRAKNGKLALVNETKHITQN